MIEFVSPTLDYALLAPILIVLGGAVLGVLIEAFAPRKSRASSQLFITCAIVPHQRLRWSQLPSMAQEC